MSEDMTLEEMLKAHPWLIRPYFIKELGERGLTAHDLAKCTETHGVHIIYAARTLIARWEKGKTPDVKYAPVKVNINGAEEASLAFNIAAAYLFVNSSQRRTNAPILRRLLVLESGIADADTRPVSDDMNAQWAKILDYMRTSPFETTPLAPMPPAPKPEETTTLQARKTEPMPVVKGEGFVDPHYIPELGEEGLTLHEVAKSLGIKFSHAKEVYEKNISDYSGAEISAPSGNPVNPMVKSYALTTEDAKFFVAGYNNEVGKAYRRYLIEFERRAKEQARPALQAYASRLSGMEAKLAASLEGHTEALKAILARLEAVVPKAEPEEKPQYIAGKLVGPGPRMEWPKDPRTFVTAREAASLLRVGLSFLARLRSEKQGPNFVKWGARVMYRVEDLLEWTNRQKQDVSKRRTHSEIRYQIERAASRHGLCLAGAENVMRYARFKPYMTDEDIEKEILAEASLWKDGVRHSR